MRRSKAIAVLVLGFATLSRADIANVIMATGQGVAAGGGHTLAIGGLGEVYGWGDNSHGQLGDGTTTERHSPVQALTVPLSMIAVSAGANHSLALTEPVGPRMGGLVYAWGNNSSGQVGDGTFTERDQPIPVLGQIVAISAGANYSLALDASGTVWAWGDNSHGQLGDGTTTSRAVPVQVLGPFGAGPLTGVSAIAAGGAHSLALINGVVWAWGDNSSGQLGDGTLSERHRPVLVGGFGRYVYINRISAGSNHSLASTSNFSLTQGVFSWGGNNSGQLGDGTHTPRVLPTQVISATVVTVVAGTNQSFALEGSQTAGNQMLGTRLFAWGSNRLEMAPSPTAAFRSPSPRCRRRRYP